MLYYKPIEIKHLNAELTRNCNLQCSYCFNDSGVNMLNELSTEEWNKVIDIAKSHGALSALFTGGEIMTRNDSPEIINYALIQELKTSILSNGYKLNNQYREILSSLDRVQISLDSASPTTHDMKRGKGSWKSARNAIDYIRSLDVPVEISTTITSDQLDELEGIVRVAYLTESKVIVRPMQAIGRAQYSGTEEYNSEIALIKQKLEEKFGEIFVDDFAQYVPISENEEGFVTVLPDGKIRGTRINIFEFDKAA